MPTSRKRMILSLVAIAAIAIPAVMLWIRFEPDADSLEPLIRKYGYSVLLAMTTLGNLGLPVPEETTALLAGAAARKGWLELNRVWFLCVTAAIFGDCLGYLIGRTGGRRLLLEIGPFVGLSQTHFMKFERFFERHGSKTVFFARFVAGLRFAAGPLSGAAGMPFKKFLICNALGALLWVTLIIELGYHFGLAVLTWLSEAGWIVLALVAIAITGLWLLHQFRPTPKPRPDAPSDDAPNKAMLNSPPHASPHD